MKKLLTILAATATALAFGAVPESQVETINHGADFEAPGFVSGANFIWSYNDSYTGPDGVRYWYTEDADAGNIISNYTGETSSKTPIEFRPDKFGNANNTKFLQVETTGKLYRSVKNNGGSSNFLTNTVESLETYGFSLDNSPIYLDTLVKFTAADSVFGDDALTEGDKIAIEYVEHESEGDGDATVTNFVIRAGFKGSELSQTNYYAYLPDDPTFANFDKDAWHRLTVRTIPDVGDGSVGFVVYVDGTNLVYSTDVSAGFGTLDGTAQGFYNAEKHALFPSAVAPDAIGGQMISAAAFSGNGSLDDVVFTTTEPAFITAGESVVVTINMGTGITNVTVTVGNDTVAPADASANPLVYNLAPGTTSFVLATYADSDNGYTVAGVSGERATWGNDTVTITGPSPVLTVTATRNNVTYIDSTTEQQQSCPSLAAAITAAKAGTTIRLLYSIDVADIEGESFTTYTISGKDLTIDLNGNTIAWNDEDAESDLFTIASKSTLRVIDSSVLNTGAIVYAGANGVFYNSGDCYIGATSGDYGPTVQGALTSKNHEPTIVRGKFDKAKNTASATFKWSDYIVEGSALGESSGDYWIVEPSGTPQPTQIPVPTAATGLVYDGTQKIGVADGTGYTLSGDYEATDAGNYTATATLEEGYIWSDSTSEAKAINWSIAAKTDATVVVTLSADIAEYSAQLEFPAASATIGGVAVEGTTNWVENAISEPEAGATNTYTVTFTVTTANYAGSTGPATFKVFKTAGGGSEDWPENPSTVSGQTAQAAFGITGDLANADAATLATWAKAKGVNYADRTTAILTDAFLLNCANTQEAIDEAAANFKITSITVAGDTVTIAPAAGDVYGNGQVAIEGATSLTSPISWHEKQAGDHFFRATLVVKPVAVP